MEAIVRRYCQSAFRRSGTRSVFSYGGTSVTAVSVQRRRQVDGFEPLIDYLHADGNPGAFLRIKSCGSACHLVCPFGRRPVFDREASFVRCLKLRVRQIEGEDPVLLAPFGPALGEGFSGYLIAIAALFGGL
jgi:hypothetical protein